MTQITRLRPTLTTNSKRLLLAYMTGWGFATTLLLGDAEGSTGTYLGFIGLHRGFVEMYLRRMNGWVKSADCSGVIARCSLWGRSADDIDLLVVLVERFWMIWF